MISLLLDCNFLQTWLLDQVNHSPDITIEDGVYEIKGAGLFSRDLIFSLRSPISLKAGEQVKYSNKYFYWSFNKCVLERF